LKAILNLSACELLDIYQLFIDESFLGDIWSSYDESHWVYGSGDSKGTLCGGKFLPSVVYAYLSVYVYITGEQDKPTKNNININAFCNSISKTMIKLRRRRRIGMPASATKLMHMFGRFHIPYRMFPDVSKRFRDVLGSLGECIACDEKLLHFTGGIGFARMVPSKPDKIGLWFYEAVVTLSNGDPFLVYSRLCDSNSKQGIHTPTSDIVKDWANIIVEFKNRGIVDAPNTVLCFDSYYATNEARKYCNDNGIKYIGAVQSNRFQALVTNMKLLCEPVDAPGKTAAIFNEESGELFLHHYDANSDVGEKYVLSNSFTRSIGRSSTTKLCQVYDQYKVMFNSFDQFNRRLRDRKFPHRSGAGEEQGWQDIVINLLWPAYCRIHSLPTRSSTQITLAMGMFYFVIYAWN
jgi:hypothetical protein